MGISLHFFVSQPKLNKFINENLYFKNLLHQVEKDSRAPLMTDPPCGNFAPLQIKYIL